MVDQGTAVIVGVGPGLGMSMARRFGREGFRVALISRSDARHAAYVADLAERGIDATAHVADVTDRSRLGAVLGDIHGAGPIGMLYYGPGPTQQPVPITDIDAVTARSAFEWVWPAVDVVSDVLPGMLDRGKGALFFAGGLSSVRPMPMLGHLALAAAALRNYALTLNAALAERGLYAGTLTIGGLVERGDIHAMVSADPARFGSTEGHTLDPDDLAETAWGMYRARDRAEAIFDVFGG
ncbi:MULTISPECIES: SDR family NAD(P)-dependent oxidoreductase [Nocardia]|uniref:SDR family NAD(P)-dependent oxidoreductase n=1 Tax=Nocardia implantans TaxID=3108168 RepID=A0ABU6AZ08_9NOCA|nr:MULTISPECIES: SDR family NAD(P)-dependent oxidoreductase [unclassified Nocardia]MBF6194208.1 SDR family NAD(P)-dependent oxidoreductase [Nocardia beijingensis]MEA3529816.1 SDR family NAD(P)-dependent oxidoreductase [Nocardia sp. CDC192]MEB3512706.1 SDR family NAD(P)-dependent oxidoreductase [Nocardia sp. CDC186]